MAGQVTLIGTYNPSGSSQTLDLTDIPGTYTDLLVKFSLKTNTGTPTGEITVNNSGSGYNYISLYNTGSGTLTNYGNNNTASMYLQYEVSTTNATMIGNLYIQDYTAAYKKMIQNDVCSMANTQQISMMHYWNNTAAITSIKFSTYTGQTYASTGTVSLYGIKKS